MATIKRRHLKPLTAAEERAVEARVAAAERRRRGTDSSDPPWTAEQVARLTVRHPGGRPRRTPGGTEPVTLRLDHDVVTWFRAQGPGYQGRINALLRAAMRRGTARRRVGATKGTKR